MGALRAISTAENLTREEREPACRLVPDQRPDSIEPSEEDIRLLSQEIWEREGRPEGYADDHWARARAELAAQMAKMANSPPEEIAEPPAAPEQLDVEVAIAPITLAVSPRPARLPIMRSQQSAVVPSIICAGLVLRGVLESPGDLQFDGCLEGEIHSNVLHVGEEAVIQGEVNADEVTVRGCIRGTIRAHRVLLCPGARVEGDIWYGTLAIESGAQPDARFHRLDDLAEEPAQL